MDPGPILNVSTDEDRVLVRLVDPPSSVGASFEIEFAPHGFPQRIGWNGEAESVLREDVEDCSRENGVGLALYPNRLFIDNLTTGEPVRPIATDLVQQILVPFEVPLAENASGPCVGSLQGSSTFTIFTDGRVHRHDVARLTVPVMDAGCAICPAGPYIFTTYTVARAQIIGGIEPSSIQPGDTQVADRIVCTRNEGRSLAVGFSDDVGAMQRFRRLLPPQSASSLAIVHDIARGTATQVSQDTPYVRDSDMLLGASDDMCSELNARLAVLTADDQPLEILEVGQLLSMNDDGIYDLGSAEIRLDEVTLAPRSTGIAGGFAVRLDFGSRSTEDLRIRHSDPELATMGWVRVRRLPDDSVLLFFRDALPADASVMIRLR